MRAYAGKIRATLCSVFPDLLRAYTDSLDADHPAPRHPASIIMTATLRLLDALIEQVRPGCRPTCWHVLPKWSSNGRVV